MSTGYLAYRSQRFQLTLDVTEYTNRYTSLGSAVWRMQIRPLAGSPVVVMDFMTGGSPQGAYMTATYDGTAKTVMFRAPALVAAQVAVGQYSFDYGFVLPGADFERAGGGGIQFVSGVTLFPVSGTPSPPDNGDDTVLPTTS